MLISVEDCSSNGFLGMVKESVAAFGRSWRLTNRATGMLLQTFRDFYRSDQIDKAEYMAVQARHRPTLQPRRPSEHVRPRRQRALTAAGPRH